MIRVTGTVGQHKHQGAGSLEPVIYPQLVARMGNYQGGALRIPAMKRNVLQ